MCPHCSFDEEKERNQRFKTTCVHHLKMDNHDRNINGDNNQRRHQNAPRQQNTKKYSNTGAPIKKTE